MKLLLTGATGFLGSHLLEALVEKGHRVIILKRSFSNTWRINHILTAHDSQITSHNIDLVPIEEAFKQHPPDMVIHLATCYRKFHSQEDVEELMRTNVEFPSLILELCRKYGVKYFINTGTFFEYDLVHSQISEKDPFRPYNLYAATKIAFENILKFYVVEYGIKAVTLKLFAPYGYRENETKLIPFLIKSILEGKDVSISKGKQRWDFTYCKDIVRAYINSMSYVQKMGTQYESFNIGKGIPNSLEEVAELLLTIAGSRTKILLEKPYNEKEIFWACADPAKAMNKLGWLPEYDLKRGLTETFEWYKKYYEER